MTLARRMRRADDGAWRCGGGDAAGGDEAARRVILVKPGTLPNDGKVIADERPVG